MSVGDEVLQLLAQVNQTGPVLVGDGSRDLNYTVSVLGHDLNWIESMTSADGTAIDVVVEETHDRPTLVEVSLRASTRRRRTQTAGRRVRLLK